MPENNDRSMQDLRPTVWIGKQGCTDTMIEEIVLQLKKRRMIKIKWLQSTDVDPRSVAEQAKARLVEVRGRTMVLAEKGKGAAAPTAAAKPATKPVAKPTARAAARSAARSPAAAPVGDRGMEKEAPPRPRQTGSLKPRKK